MAHATTEQPPRIGRAEVTDRSVLAVGVLVITAMVVVWVCRTRYLFSWDSANYAFAVSQIDIAAHRPHPPGYLGYVFAARALGAMFSRLSVNGAFIVWNAVALAAAAIFTASLADDSESGAHGRIIAVLLLLSSPLVLFYASTAEIYVSEMACAAAIAWSAREALRGRSNALYWCAVGAAVTALFKLPTLILMLPVIVYAFAAAPVHSRKGPLVILVLALGSVALLFVLVQSGFVSVVWTQFVSATSGTRVIGAAGHVDVGRILNRNARDTLVALLSALGLNSIAVGAWIATDRRLPSFAGGRFLALWITPWLLEFLFVHVAKPGYVLPLLPAVSLVLAGFYSRRSRTMRLACVSASAAAGLGWFLFVSPPHPDPNDTRHYRDKPFVERMASDFGGVAFPTLATIRNSDRETESLLDAAATCRSVAWTVVAGSAGVDWRRAMYYLPASVVVDLADGHYPFVGQNGTFVPASVEVPISSDCGLLWIALEKPALTTSANPQAVADVGWRYPAGRGIVTPTTIAWDPLSHIGTQRGRLR